MQDKKSPDSSERLEQRIGISLTIIATLLAMTELLAGEIEEQELFGVNKKTEMYNRYNAKSIKQTLVEGQLDLITSLQKGKLLISDTNISQYIQQLQRNINRYDQEKNEILLGSQTVGEKNRAQDINGQLGQVIGSTQWNDFLNQLNTVGGYTDSAIFTFQIALVFGAMSLIFKSFQSRTRFWKIMMGISVIAISILLVSVIKFFGINSPW